MAYSVYFEDIAICVVAAKFVSCAVEAQDEFFGSCGFLHEAFTDLMQWVMT